MYRLYLISNNANTHARARFLVEFIKQASHIDGLVLYALDKDLIELAKALRKTSPVVNNKIVHVHDDFYLQGTQEEF